MQELAEYDGCGGETDNKKFWPVVARENQTPTRRGWTNWLLMGGRGSGKTRSGSEWVHALATGKRFYGGRMVGRFALVGETYGDAREVMVEGESGLLAIHSNRERPKWISSRKRLEWNNGAVAQLFSSEDPDALRGPQFSGAWCDVFFDPKSSESFTPYFTNGGRDDFAQAAYIEAHQTYWDTDHPAYASGNNPLSQVTGEPMVDMHRAQLWAWDARPYPAFPARTDIWSDGGNWYTGHWLNGRLGRLRLADLIAELLTGAGIPSFDVTQVYGVIDGYVLADAGTARNALEALLNLYNISVHEDAGTLYFRSQGAESLAVFDADLLVTATDQVKLSSQSEQVRDLPAAHRRGTGISSGRNLRPPNRWFNAAGAHAFPAHSGIGKCDRSSA